MAGIPEGVRVRLLSATEQRGLFGELHFLREQLLLPFGAAIAVGAWNGPTGHPKDFRAAWHRRRDQDDAGRDPGSGSDQQRGAARDAGLVALYLVVTVLADQRAGGETLHRLVEDLRSRIDVPHSSRLTTSARVWLHDRYSPDYDITSYVVRHQLVFRVENDFPRLLLRKPAAGRARRSLRPVIGSCRPFDAILRSWGDTQTLRAWGVKCPSKIPDSTSTWSSYVPASRTRQPSFTTRMIRSPP